MAQLRLLAAPGLQDAFSGTSNLVTGAAARRVAQAFYACFSITAFTEIGLVLVITRHDPYIHLSLMLINDDMLWFVITCSFFTNELPQVFLVIGIVYWLLLLVGNTTTGSIVSIIGTIVAFWGGRRINCASGMVDYVEI